MIFGWMWVLLAILSAVLYLTTKKTWCAAVSLSALLPLFFDIFSIDFLWQTVAFALLVAALILVFNFVFSRVASSSASPDSLVGARCVVVERIDENAGCGLVRVGNQQWSARPVGDAVYESGEVLHVVAIEGVKLICRK